MVVTLALGLRALTMLGFRPGRIYWYDTYTYLQLAYELTPREDLNPNGYPFLLRLLMPFHSIPVVVGVQHAMGLGVGVMIYALLRRKGVPAWGAAAAAVPVLFDTSFLRLEHAVLGDTLFVFLLVAATVLLSWSSAPPLWAGATAGVFLAWAALTRTVGLPIFLVALGWLAVRRVGWRPLVVTALAGALPLLSYAAWYQAEYGRFKLVGGDGAALWARVMTFADCDVIKPPPAEAPLCPNGTWRDAAEGYYWAPEASLNRMPGGRKENDSLARSFAVHAVLAQPLDYLRTVAGDVSLAFHWTPADHPMRMSGPLSLWGGVAAPAVPDWARSYLRRYAPGVTGEYEAVQPYAGFLQAFQNPSYLRGPFLGVILLLGAAGLRRKDVLLPWGTAVVLLVLPVAVLDFDHRYVLPVVPFACLAAALAVSARFRAG
ncbi:phospholipid carrier-dependent glycosyltransferase [Streptosporangium sp. NPDC020145]|uniref:Phospholipid carrier-dependent glycosyltransferase n=1 Tax=Streptosporangium jomthongense TaxID=1193683 RepID=A0ABV8FEU8_9ACTN